ncbi:MAG: histidine phosphatase family protein [Acidimicrobiales bacterium]
MPAFFINSSSALTIFSGFSKRRLSIDWHAQPVHGPASRRLWLVRHGESTWNALGLVQGQVTVPTLTAFGMCQARAQADSLSGEPITWLYSSDLRRALQTASPIGRALGLDVHLDVRLRERSLGTAEGTPSALLGPERSGIAEGRVVDADAAPEGGESVRQLYRRASECVTELLRAGGDGDIALVCHGGIVRVLLAWLDEIEPDEMSWVDVDNGSAIVRAAPAPALAGST